MRSLIITIFLLTTINLFASKPFSTWQFDKEIQIKFGKEECQFEIKTDNMEKEFGYQNTDILTDENGNLLFSFDDYDKKIVIRNNSDVVIFEHYFDNQEVRTNVESIILPFYSDDIYYYVYISTFDNELTGTLNYIKIDNSSGVTTFKSETLIEEDMSRYLLSATISQDKRSYFLASVISDPNFVHITQLFADERIIKNTFDQLDTLAEERVFAGMLMKFSPQGDKLIINHTGSIFKFFNFNNSNGDITKLYELDFNETLNYNIRSMFEFSQDGSKLYAQSGHDNYIIHQFDLNNWGDKDYFLNSMKIVWSTEASCVDCLFREFQLAPNNRIYIKYLYSYTGRKDSTFLGVINCPNSDAPNVGFQHLGLGITDKRINVPHLQNIPTNFLSEPQPFTVFDRLLDKIRFCSNSKAIVEGIDDPCGEHTWVKSNGERVYSKDLVFEDISKDDTGFYFYNFRNCNQIFNDTFQIEVYDNYNPEIVLVAPQEINLCSSPLEGIKFTTKEQYDNYNWSLTDPLTNSKTQLGNEDTILVSDLGLLQVEVSSNSGCSGIAEYKLEIPEIEFHRDTIVEITICRGIELIESIRFPISSDSELRVDSVKFRNGNQITITNEPFLLGKYIDGNFNKSINLNFDNSVVGIINDTLEFYVYDNCYRTISVPVIINVISSTFTLEIPHLKGQIGDSPFEIPIYLTTTCLENISSIDFEATISLLKSKFYIQSVKGINLIDKWEDYANTNIKFSYQENQLKTNSKFKIGSLIGTVLLTNIDSTSIILSDIITNRNFEILDGSLVTNEICMQEYRQVDFIIEDDPNITVSEKIITFETSGDYRGSYNLELIDYMGRVVKSIEIEKNTEVYLNQFEINTIASGLYYLSIKNEYKSRLFKIFVE